MPTYAYICRWCGWECLEFYKSLPADPNAPIKCRGCAEHDADRNFAKDAGASVLVGNAKSEGLDKVAGLAHKLGGKAYYHDQNGKKQEVRTVRDVDKWANGNNTLGRPRMFERLNRFTGQKEWVPIRDKNGSIQRQGERLIPLGSGDRSVTSEKAGALDDRGVAKPKVFVDPETRERKSASDLWDDSGDASGYAPPRRG